jgi:hypothetical protein
MPKEHSGGVDNGALFRVPGEWIEDQRFAVKIENFNFDALDSIDDHIRQELATKGSAKSFVRKLVALDLQKARIETLVSVLGAIKDAADSGLAVVQISCACGMLLTAGETDDYYAAQYGISKQAFQQGVEMYRKRFGLRQTRIMRDQEARDLMRDSNYRRPTI